jgi:hypothetical protein
MEIVLRRQGDRGEGCWGYGRTEQAGAEAEVDDVLDSSADTIAELLLQAPVPLLVVMKGEVPIEEVYFEKLPVPAP